MDKRVKAWRWRIVKKYGTQKAFCEKYDLSETQLSEWITGSKVPKEHNIERIELLLNCGGA